MPDAPPARLVAIVEEALRGNLNPQTDSEEKRVDEMTEAIARALVMARWGEAFSTNELRVVLRGLRNVDAYWAPAANLSTVKKMRNVRNQRDRMVTELQVELDGRAPIASQP